MVWNLNSKLLKDNWSPKTKNVYVKGMTHPPYSLDIFLSSYRINTPQSDEGPTSRKSLLRLLSRAKIEMIVENSGSTKYLKCLSSLFKCLSSLFDTLWVTPPLAKKTLCCKECRWRK